MPKGRTAPLRLLIQSDQIVMEAGPSLPKLKLAACDELLGQPLLLYVEFRGHYGLLKDVMDTGSLFAKSLRQTRAQVFNLRGTEIEQVAAYADMVPAIMKNLRKDWRIVHPQDRLRAVQETDPEIRPNRLLACFDPRAIGQPPAMLKAGRSRLEWMAYCAASLNGFGPVWHDTDMEPREIARFLDVAFSKADCNFIPKIAEFLRKEKLPVDLLCAFWDVDVTSVLRRLDMTADRTARAGLYDRKSALAVAHALWGRLRDQQAQWHTFARQVRQGRLLGSTRDDATGLWKSAYPEPSNVEHVSFGGTK